tara:strand:- start:569 stop:925 length:357 start_codon:yes stop_codon:yes gene_type:complete
MSNITEGRPPVRKVRALSLDEAIDGEARRVDIEDQKIAIVRIEGNIYAIADMCSHANYSLSEGPVDSEEITIECWKHGAQFSLCDGSPVSLPATQPVEIFEVETDENDIYILIPESSN